MRVEELHHITGIFQKCTIEPGIDGWSVFDKQKKFICLITIFGVALSEKYDHYDKLVQKLSVEKIPFWSLDTSEKLALQEIQDMMPEIEEEEPIEATLYQEPQEYAQPTTAPIPHAFGDDAPF